MSLPVHINEKAAPRWQQGSVGTFTRLAHFLVACVLFLLPSFVVQYLPGQHKAPRSTALHPTAYLDGLRGVSAFIVFTFHYSYRWSMQQYFGYGSIENGQDNTWFIQLPFVRLIIAGSSAVTLFFVISGYVLSIKPLTLIYKGQYLQFYQNISGAVFRRWLRLYLPIIIVTFMISYLRRVPMLPWKSSRTGSQLPPLANNAYDQFWNFYALTKDFVNPWRMDCGQSRLYPCLPPPHNTPLWTIPLEFQYSLMIFLFLLAFARTKRWISTVFTVSLAVWQLNEGKADIFLFLGGMLLAEMSINFPASTAPKVLDIVTLKSLTPRQVHRLHHGISTVALIIILFLLSFPFSGTATSTGYAYLTSLVPHWYKQPMLLQNAQLYWLAIASVAFVFLLMYSAPLRMPTPGQTVPDPPMLQRLFTNRVSQYLGFISYSMYLCHDMVLNTVATHYSTQGDILMMDWMARMPHFTSETEKAQYMVRWRSQYYIWVAMGYFWSTVAVIWIGDVVTRAVDIPCVNVTRQLSKWVQKKEDEEK